MSCVTIVTKTLEESTGVEKVEFDPATETWALRTQAGFDSEAVSRRILKAGEEHSRRVGRPDDPAWTARWIQQERR